MSKLFDNSDVFIAFVEFNKPTTEVQHLIVFRKTGKVTYANNQLWKIQQLFKTSRFLSLTGTANDFKHIFKFHIAMPLKFLKLWV